MAEDSRNRPPDAPGFSDYYLGVDVGGTFTDLVFYAEGGELHCLKVPSTPNAPGRSTLLGIDELRSSLPAGSEGWARMHHTHSSTVATNAIIERRGARCGLLTTAGFRDLLELQRLAVPNPMQYTSRRPPPLIPRALVRDIDERVTADGEEVVPLDERQLRDAVRDLRAQAVRIVVVCFLHSYRYPAHEEQAGRLIAREFADLQVELSSRVWPQAREYERATLTALNAFVRPTVEGYVDELVAGLAGRGVATPVRIARSNGGMELGATIRGRPVVTLLSGPAAGVAGAATAALDAGWVDADLMTLDVGGTSADIGVIRGGRSVLSSEEHVADFPLLVPTVAVSSIGAGGGSIVWVDDAGSLRVGPQSAGADPGPACYHAGGGGRPALTDAFLVSGILRPDRRLGGRLPLYEEPALEALGSVGAGVGLDAAAVADGALQVAIAMTAAEATAVLARRGVDLPDFGMVAFGGAGPTLAAFVADEVAIDRVLIPATPGALSALGAARADLEGDLVRPVYRLLHQVAARELDAEAAALSRRVEAWVGEQTEELSLQGLRVELSADMRYDGQGYDVAVPLDPAWLREGDLGLIAQRFHAAHEATYGHADPGAAVWVKELRAHVVGRLGRPAAGRLPVVGTPGEPERRRVRLAGEEVLATVRWRPDLGAGEALRGPAIVEQMDATTVVPPGWTARVLDSSAIVLERRR